MSVGEDRVVHSCKTLDEVLFDFVEQDDVDGIRTFLSWGYDINYHERQVNILQASCAWNKPNVLAFCIKQGMDINEPEGGFHRQYPLISTIVGHCWECFELLLDAGVDVNVKGYGHSALELYVTEKRSLNAIRKFLRHGACVNDLIIEQSFVDTFGEDPEFFSELRELLYAAGALSVRKLNDDIERVYAGVPMRLEEMCITSIRNTLWHKKEKNIFIEAEKLPSEINGRIFPRWCKEMLVHGQTIKEQ